MAEKAKSSKGRRKSAPGKGASSSGKQAKRVLPTLEQAARWLDRRVDGMGERSLGRVVGIHVDAKDGLPRWAVIKLGPLAGTTGIPIEHLAEGAPRRLFAAYPRELVRSAVRFGPDEPLTVGDERELCESLDFPPGAGRLEELEGKRATTMSSKPAEIPGGEAGDDD